jgi:hypothetical protein
MSSGMEWGAATTAEVMRRAGHARPQSALRYQHATGDRDQVLAKALAALASLAKVVPIRTAGTGREAGRSSTDPVDGDLGPPAARAVLRVAGVAADQQRTPCKRSARAPVARCMVATASLCAAMVPSRAATGTRHVRTARISVAPAAANEATVRCGHDTPSVALVDWNATGPLRRSPAGPGARRAKDARYSIGCKERGVRSRSAVPQTSGVGGPRCTRRPRRCSGPSWRWPDNQSGEGATPGARATGPLPRAPRPPETPGRR